MRRYTQAHFGHFMGNLLSELNDGSDPNMTPIEAMRLLNDDLHRGAYYSITFQAFLGGATIYEAADILYLFRDLNTKLPWETDLMKALRFRLGYFAPKAS